MGGWDALAAAPVEEEAPVVKEVKEEKVKEEPKAPITSTAFVSKFPSIDEEMLSLANPPKFPPSNIMCGIVGHEGGGKTGIAMDGHMHRYTDGELMYVIDFDNGAMACHQAHYNGDPRIRIFRPWVMQVEDRTAYNYLATYQRVMDLAKYAVEYAEKQQEEGFDEPILKSFLVTGVDQFDSVCINNMKIYDLEMNATDAIEASAAKLNSEIGWNWNIRSTRFKQLTAICQKLNALGVDVYWETHLKEDKEGKVGFDGWKFAWEKSANNDLFQIIWCKSKVIRNNDGSETGEVRHYADFFKQKTNSNLKGQERTYFVTKKGEDAEWFGLSELRDGVL
tara:strand:- start:682 stop:1689 length:1008 start_codon:yes stop_codon:yes gene_type:complete